MIIIYPGSAQSWQSHASVKVIIVIACDFKGLFGGSPTLYVYVILTIKGNKELNWILFLNNSVWLS